MFHAFDIAGSNEGTEAGAPPGTLVAESMAGWLSMLG
jgi:hypothetical protein